MASLMNFVERVRTLQDLPLLGAIVLRGTEADDPDNCVLAQALGASIGSVGAGTPDDPAWPILGLRVKDRLTARRIGIVMDLGWRGDPPAVALPDAVTDLAVSQSRGCVEADEMGFLRGWWVPADPDEATWVFRTPDEELVPDAQWNLPRQG